MSTPLNQTKMRARLQRELETGYQGEPLRRVDLYRLDSDGVAHHVLPAWEASWDCDLKELVTAMASALKNDFKTVAEPLAVYKFMFFHGTRVLPGNGPFIQRVERGVS